MQNSENPKENTINNKSKNSNLWSISILPERFYKEIIIYAIIWHMYLFNLHCQWYENECINEMENLDVFI